MQIPLWQKLGLKAVVFDFDGTLAVPTLDFGVMRERALAVMRQYREVPEESARLPVLELLDLLSVGLTPDEGGKLRRETLEAVRRYELEAASASALFPEVRGMLRALEALAIKTAIITRNCLDSVNMVFPDLRDFNTELLTREQVPRVKPDPDHLLRALALLDILPQNALMVGDHPMDILVGQRAGTLSAGVAGGHSEAFMLQKAQADFVFPGLAGLMAHLGVII